MNANELLHFQLSKVEFQLTKAFEGIQGEQWHRRSCAEAMTPHELAIHLSECYVASVAELQGGHYEWGSFVVENPEDSAILAKMFDLRKEAVSAILGADTDAARKLGADFLVQHDCYHIGQLATLRIQLGEWNPYSIYEQG